MTAVVAVLCALAIAVAAGCGGGGNKDASGTTSAEAAATTEAVTTTAMTAEADTTSSTVSNLSKLASAANCRQLAGLGTQLSQAFSGADSNDLQEQAKFFKNFADRTPEDIRPDFELVADAFTKIADALKGMNLQNGQTPSADAIAKLQKLSGEIDQKKLLAAQQHITAWVSNNCHG